MKIVTTCNYGRMVYGQPTLLYDDKNQEIDLTIDPKNEVIQMDELLFVNNGNRRFYNGVMMVNLLMSCPEPSRIDIINLISELESESLYLITDIRVSGGCVFLTQQYQYHHKYANSDGIRVAFGF